MGKMTEKINNIVLTPMVQPGEIRVVLSWPDAPDDLDLYSIFKTGNFTKCIVFYGKPDCSSTHIEVINNQGGRKGAETITINFLEKYIYTFAVRKYISKSKDNLAPDEKRVEGAPLSSDYNYEIPVDINEKKEIFADVNLSESKAKVAIFIHGFQSAIQEIFVPSNYEGNLLLDSDKSKNTLDWWVPFCINGERGLDSLMILNKLTSNLPNDDICRKIYNNQSVLDNPSNYNKNALNNSTYVQVKSLNKLKRFY